MHDPKGLKSPTGIYRQKKVIIIPKYKVKGHYRYIRGKRAYVKGYKRHYSGWDKQLRIGTKVEMEHTKNKRFARKIAIDHLKEDRTYYTKLKRCGL